MHLFIYIFSLFFLFFHCNQCVTLQWRFQQWRISSSELPQRTESHYGGLPTCWTEYLGEASRRNGSSYVLCFCLLLLLFHERWRELRVRLWFSLRYTWFYFLLLFLFSANRWSNWRRVGLMWYGGREERQRSFWRRILLIYYSTVSILMPTEG